MDVSNIDDEDIIIYLAKRGSGTYAEKDYKGKNKEFLDLHNAWTAEQVLLLLRLTRSSSTIPLTRKDT